MHSGKYCSYQYIVFSNTFISVSWLRDLCVIYVSERLTLYQQEAPLQPALTALSAALDPLQLWLPLPALGFWIQLLFSLFQNCKIFPPPMHRLFCSVSFFFFEIKV